MTLKLNSKNVYQAIWDVDQDEKRGNGIPALDYISDSQGDRERGFVLVDEKESPRNTDHKVLPKAFIPKGKRDTYDKCRTLFDNYVFKEIQNDNGDTENDSEKDKTEIDDFINSIKDTAPMKVAREYLDSNQTDSEWYNAIKKAWFTMGSSYKKEGNQRSGFEHVFVGEDTGKLGGYHYWHKYFINDGGDDDGDGGNEAEEDRITHDGARYDRRLNAKGMSTPEVITLEFKYKDLKKNQGGFWVGCSPEGLIALGMARTKEKTKPEVFTYINNVEYMIKMYMLTEKGKEDSIDTFWPRFERILSEEEKIDINPNDLERFFSTVDPMPRLPNTKPNGPVFIFAARINPPGPDDLRPELVGIENSSQNSISMDGWKLVITNGNDRAPIASFNLTGTVRSLQRYIEPLRNVLPNEGATLTLSDAEGKILDAIQWGPVADSVDVWFISTMKPDEPDEPDLSKVFIAAAMIKPEGDQRANEWVSIANNSSSTINLDGWTLSDTNREPYLLSGSLVAGETKKLNPLTSNNGGEVQLGNNGGTLILKTKDGTLVDSVNWKGAGRGKSVEFN